MGPLCYAVTMATVAVLSWRVRVFHKVVKRQCLVLRSAPRWALLSLPGHCLLLILRRLCCPSEFQAASCKILILLQAEKTPCARVQRNSPGGKALLSLSLSIEGWKRRSPDQNGRVRFVKTPPVSLKIWLCFLLLGLGLGHRFLRCLHADHVLTFFVCRLKPVLQPFWPQRPRQLFSSCFQQPALSSISFPLAPFPLQVAGNWWPVARTYQNTSQDTTKKCQADCGRLLEYKRRSSQARLPGCKLFSSTQEEYFQNATEQMTITMIEGRRRLKTTLGSYETESSNLTVLRT